MRIMGGERENVPLEPTASELIADFLVAKQISTILDIYEFNESDMVRFVPTSPSGSAGPTASPCTGLLTRPMNSPPQTGYNAAATMCLGAIQRIARPARGRGIGVTLASQRSAVVNKSVLTQDGTLIAMQRTAPHDLRAIDAWLEYAATQEARREITEASPSLNPREALVYLP